jgi:hypothetical protein
MTDFISLDEPAIQGLLFKGGSIKLNNILTVIHALRCALEMPNADEIDVFYSKGLEVSTSEEFAHIRQDRALCIQMLPECIYFGAFFANRLKVSMPGAEKAADAIKEKLFSYLDDFESAT